MLLHDNCRFHKVRNVQAIIANRGFTELPHPPYTTDLAPYDFFLFKHLKKYLRGRKFASDDDLKGTVASFFEAQTFFFFDEMKQLEKRWPNLLA